MKFKKLFALGFAACMVFAAGCNGAGATEYEYIREIGRVEYAEVFLIG